MEDEVLRILDDIQKKKISVEKAIKQLEKYPKVKIKFLPKRHVSWITVSMRLNRFIIWIPFYLPLTKIIVLLIVRKKLNPDEYNMLKDSFKVIRKMDAGTEICIDVDSKDDGLNKIKVKLKFA